MFACEQSIDLLVQAAKNANVPCKFVVYGSHPEFPSLRTVLAQQSQEEVDNFKHAEPTNPKKVGAIFFSSGTTGKQKGTMVSYDSLVNNRMIYMHLNENDVGLWYSSLSWITGTNLTILAIRKRAVRIIHANFDPDETGRVIEKYEVRNMYTTKYVLIIFLKLYNFFSAKTISFLETLSNHLYIQTYI